RAAGGLSQGGCVTPASMFRGDLLASYLLCPPARPDLPSFPTRRSSDLERAVRISRGSRIRDDPRERGRGTAPVPSRIVAIAVVRSEEHTSELQSRFDLVCRLLLEKKKTPCTDDYHLSSRSHSALRPSLT